jgi:hypothetical protein
MHIFDIFKRKSYIMCERCGLSWSWSAFRNMDTIKRKMFIEGNGCPICYNENWCDGHYI